MEKVESVKELDEEATRVIADIANAELKEHFSLLGVFFEPWMVVYVLKAYCEWEGERSG